MENIPELNDLDIFCAEQQLREKIYELQEKSAMLEKTQKELLETRHSLYKSKSILENENQINDELKMQLSAAVAMINRLEDEKMKTYIEHVQLKVNYDAMINERNSLIEQTKATKLEIIDSNIKLQTAEDEISNLKMLNKNLEESLTMLRDNTLQMIATAESEIAKLKKEHQYLQQSCQNIIDLNKRLQIFGLCAHSIHQRDKIEIQRLQCKLNSLSSDISNHPDSNTMLHPEIQKLCVKVKWIYIRKSLLYVRVRIHERK
uniref:rho-associated protein kinase 1-like isoform X1 n=1 Tax=Vespula vulgaris TaxID=7454 RepID=UPI002120AF62|nr:rho-associated protein kinase 1-like isoform X1 [Vespula vulgaris]